MFHPREFPETRPSLLASLGADGEQAQSAWRDFYDHYAPAVYRVTRLRGLSTADGEDVVQQVMVAVARHIDNFDYDASRGQFRNWVRKVTEHKIADLFRRRPRERLDEGALAGACDDQPSLDEIWEQEWRRQDLQHCLRLVGRDISPRRVQAFQLYVLDGVSAEETARRLGMSKGHVYVIRHAVLNLLREYMSELRK